MTSTIVASDLEILVLNWLAKKGVNFQFQTSFAGGFFALGGAVVDIIIPDRMLAWRVAGEYWHAGVEKTGADTIQREMLTALGYVVVDLLSSDLENRLEETLTKALRGEEMLR